MRHVIFSIKCHILKNKNNMKIEFKEHFEMTNEELEERIFQFDRQYYEVQLLHSSITPELKIYLNYIKEEIELCKIELELRCIRKN